MGKEHSRSKGGKALSDHQSDILIKLRSGERKDLVILVVPSRDRKDEPIPDQHMWAEAGLDVLANLYRGATAFKAYAGIFRTDAGKILHDEPILLEAYADRRDVESGDKLNSLLRFTVRMGKETDQDTVAIVVNDFMHFIPIVGR